MIKPSIRSFCRVAFVLCLCYVALDLTGFLNFAPDEYIVVKGIKPVDAEIYGYLRSADTNKLCLQENWLSGTKYLSTYDDKLQFITYSGDGDSYQIKVPLVPEHASIKCDTKVRAVQVAVKSPGAKTRYAELKIRITQPENHRPSQNISDSLYVKSICQSYISPRTKKWSKLISCDYFNKGKIFVKDDETNASVTLFPDLFKAGTVITYDIIPGENYFTTLERPE
ncbi:MAG: hypothetical protein ACERJ1_15535 [Halodesulfovibrio sp.]|uniref:hypothetical protein n=1 Tax=Halodesulfovibrio sp. TaxID=1912772 RepID=UPI00359E2771